MQHEDIPLPPDADYHEYNEDDHPTVLRVRGDQDRYACQLFVLKIGDVGGEYDTLQDRRSITLTRKQVSDLAQHLVALLAAQP